MAASREHVPGANGAGLMRLQHFLFREKARAVAIIEISKDPLLSIGWNIFEMKSFWTGKQSMS